MASTLQFVRKPSPAKASLDAERLKARVLRDLQVLTRIDPDGAKHVEHYAADLRLRAELAVRPQSERTS